MKPTGLVAKYLTDKMPNLLNGQNVEVQAVESYENGLEILQEGHRILLYSQEAEAKIIEKITIGKCKGDQEMTFQYVFDADTQTWREI